MHQFMKVVCVGDSRGDPTDHNNIEECEAAQIFTIIEESHKVGSLG